MIATSFWNGGRPISTEEFLSNLYGELPKFFKNEEELRTLWSNPITRRTLLENLSDAGFGKGELTTLQKLINAEKSDLFDVLEYIAYAENPISRENRVEAAKGNVFPLLSIKHKEFLEYVMAKYIETGVEELDQEKLPILLTNKYQSLEDAKEALGSVADISALFLEFQKHLYAKKAA